MLRSSEQFLPSPEDEVEVPGRGQPEGREAEERGKESQFSFLRQKLDTYLDQEESLPESWRGSVTGLIRAAEVQFQRVEAVVSSKDLDQASLNEALLGAASVEAALGNTFDELTGGKIRGLNRVQQGVLSSFVKTAQLRLDRLPKFSLEHTPSEGVESLQDLLKQQQSGGAYAKLAGGGAKRISAWVENKVRSNLEWLSGKFPSLELGRIVDRTSHLSGRVAFGLTAFGIGAVALGSYVREHAPGEFEAFGGLDVVEHEQSGVIEIKGEGSEAEVVIVPYAQLGNYETTTASNGLFEKIASVNVESNGVTYELEDLKSFTEAVDEDGERMAQQLFQKSLDGVGPTEFVQLVNAMVEERLEYDDAAIGPEISDKMSQEERAVAEAKRAEARTENNKISRMPIDKIYVEYQKGVCRHYAALVEAVGESLIERGKVPKCAGMAIDEVDSVQAQDHAWNIWYLNPESDKQNSVVMSFTDATWDDSTKQFFDFLEARDDKHASVEQSLRNLPIFNQAEIKEIYTELVKLNLGTMETRLAHRKLSSMSLHEYELELKNTEERLSERALGVLRQAIDHSRESGLYERGDFGGGIRYDYFTASLYLADNLIELGRNEEAAGYAQEALEVAKLAENEIRIEHFEETLANIKKNSTQ